MKSFSFSLPSFVAGMAAALLGLIAVLAGCAVTNPDIPAMNDAPLDDYRAALKAYHQTHPQGVSADAESKGLEAWRGLLADLSKENVEGKAARVYAGQTFFNDTLKTLRSGEAVEHYLVETAELLHSGSVEYDDALRSSDGTWYVRWEMVYSGKKLAGGEPIRTIGMSHLAFDDAGRVVLHQDFWDSTRGIFEHIPVVGGQLRFIKKRL